MKIPFDLATALLAVGLGVLALVYATEALHALVAHYWLSASVCAPTSVVYGWAFSRAFGKLKEKDHDAPG